MVFNSGALDALKEKERILKEKQESKYFRSKIIHKDLYDQITAAMAPYLTDTNLCMLSHPWSTQKNEAMNTSVASYAPKSKNFAGTISLKTRVGIAAGVQSLGYLKFWTRVFDELGLEMDHEFASSLTARDTKKDKKDIRQKSTEGKGKRRKGYRDKFDQLHKDQMNDAKSGMQYGSGVALEEAKKQAKRILTAERNPKGTPKEQLRCPYYHPLYCTILGHDSCRSKECGVNNKSAAERKEIVKELNKVRKEEAFARAIQESGT